MIRPRDPGAHADFLTSGCTQRNQESADPSMRVRDLSAWYQTTPDLAGTRDGAPALNPSVKDMDEMDHLRRLKKWQLWFMVCGMHVARQSG